MCFTGTSYTVNGDERLLSHEQQTLTLTDEKATLLDSPDDSKILLETKKLVPSQRWKRTAEDGEDYFQLQSKENNEVLTLNNDGELRIEAMASDNDGMFIPITIGAKFFHEFSVEFCIKPNLHPYTQYPIIRNGPIRNNKLSSKNDKKTITSHFLNS